MNSKLIANLAALAAAFLSGATATLAATNDAVQPSAPGMEACCCETSVICPCNQLLYNPAFGDDIYHTHPAGGGMVNVKYMHMDMDGLRAGTHDVGLDKVGYNSGKPYDYMMIPTSMTMDMYMLMAMYGLTDDLTIMAMANYQENAMRMLMDMGMGMPSREPVMHTRGFSDTELRGIYQITPVIVDSLGLSLPTGDINQPEKTMGMMFRAPYDMQLGSGSFDLKPALTYSELSADDLWNWGAQAMYTWHTADNANDYRLGDSVKVDGWLQRAIGSAAVWVRAAYSHTESIQGRDAEIQKLLGPSMMSAPSPDADTANYGGERVDGAVGVSYRIGRYSLGVEGGVPLYQNLNGLQMKTDWFLTAGMQAMF